MHWSTLVAREAFAACRVSASGYYSFDTRLSLGLARQCRMTVDVFDGGSCGPTPRWHALLPCDQTERMAILDRGRLISILTPLAKRRDFNGIRVIWNGGRWAWVTCTSSRDRSRSKARSFSRSRAMP